MIKKYSLISGIVLLIVFMSSVVKADDNFYAISNNILISNNFKSVVNDKIINDMLIDNNSIYLYTINNFYSMNKNNGSINYKLYISKIKEIKQTDNYIYISKDKEIIMINKSSGNIETKNIFNSVIDNIYSFFGTSSTIITGMNGVNGSNGVNGTNGSNGINGTNGTNGINGINGINGTNGINQSDNTKVNKSGDIITGELTIGGNNINMTTIIIKDDEILGGYNASLYNINFKNTINYASQYDKYVMVTNNAYQSSLFYGFITNNSKFIALDFRPSGNLYWRFGMDANDDFTVHKYGGAGKVAIVDSNIELSTAGKGVTLYSPNNSPFCTTVNNLGVLITTGGVCT